MLRRSAVAVAAMTLMAVVVPGTAEATYPGTNGLIAYTNYQTDDIYVMNADGSLPGPFVADPHLSEDYPAWSADGEQLAFSSIDLRDGADADFDLEVIKADGTDRHMVMDTKQYEYFPAWSPDGSQIAYVRAAGLTSSLWVVNADGTGAHKLTDDEIVYGPIDWRPDGAAIVFTDAINESTQLAQYTFVDDAVTGVTPLLANTSDDRPTYSPDGTKIAYLHFPFDGDTDPTVHVIDVDGTDDHTLETNTPFVGGLAWSPDGTGVLVGESDDPPEVAIADPDGTGRTVISTEIMNNASWQACPDTSCTVSSPRDSKTVVTDTFRRGNNIKVFVTVGPNRAGDNVDISVFRKRKGDAEFKLVGTKSVELDSYSGTKARFEVGRSGKCKAVAEYHGATDYRLSFDADKFSCKDGF